MKIAIIGAYGDVGQCAVMALEERHEIVRVGRSQGDIRADMEDLDSIRNMYRQIGPLDAVVSAVGSVHFGPIDEMNQAQFMIGVQRKLLSQINLVLEGINSVNDGGFIHTYVRCIQP